MSNEAPLLRRFALIGDVHGEDSALAATLDYLKTIRGLDAILCTGDLPGKMGVGDATRCVQLLQAAGAIVIRGNHDRWAIDSDGVREMLSMADEAYTEATRDYLANLPPTLTFETPIGPLLLCHGIGDDDMAWLSPDGSDEEIRRLLKEKRIYRQFRVMVAGHTHKRLVRLLGTLTVVNPGTLLWDKEPGFAVADIEENTVQFYNLTPFTNAITKAETRPLFFLDGTITEEPTDA